MTTTPIPELRAIRTWNRPRTKATLTILADGQEIASLGGKRAGNAEAVLVGEHPHRSPRAVSYTHLTLPTN